MTTSEPRAADPLTRPPLFSVTRNTTGTPAAGAPATSITRATRGNARSLPARPVWLLPVITEIAPLAIVRVTTIEAVAWLPERSVAVTCTVFGPSDRGTFWAMKERFDTCAATPLTATVACCGFTVPTTMSLTMPLTAIEAAVVVASGSGVVTLRRGGVVSSVTCTLAVVTVPLELVATAVIVFVPSRMGTCAENVVPVTAAAMPLTRTCAFRSPTVPVTWIGLTLRKSRLAGEVMEMFDAVPATVSVSGAESTRRMRPLNPAETRRVIGPGVSSYSVCRHV